MREDAFRAYLAPLLGGPSVVASYLSNARLVERRLHVDLDQIDLGEAIPAIGARLIDAGVSTAKAADCRSALRHYHAMQSGRAATVSTKRLPLPSAIIQSIARHSAVTGSTIPDLMRLYGDILGELRDRGVARTANGPVGDYAEYLFARAFGWTLASNSESGFDAHDAAGRRYQIKGRRLDTPRAARHLGAIRRLSTDAFDTLALALFDADMNVTRAALVPQALVVERATFVSHANSWRLMAPDLLWRLPGVTDATETVRAAERTT